MLTSFLLVMLQLVHHSSERNGSFCIACGGLHFIFHNPVCNPEKPILVPQWALTCPPVSSTTSLLFPWPERYAFSKMGKVLKLSFSQKLGKVLMDVPFPSQSCRGIA